jgi:hypothetical protein
MSEAVEEVEVESEGVPPIDEDHPWVEASRYMSPQPGDVLVKFDEVVLELAGQKVPCALMSVVTSTGVQTVFLTPPQLAHLLAQGADVLETFRPPSNGLVVANDQDMKQAVRADKASKKLKG